MLKLSRRLLSNFNNIETKIQPKKLFPKVNSIKPSKKILFHQINSKIDKIEDIFIRKASLTSNDILSQPFLNKEIKYPDNLLELRTQFKCRQKQKNRNTVKKRVVFIDKNKDIWVVRPEKNHLMRNKSKNNILRKKALMKIPHAFKNKWLKMLPYWRKLRRYYRNSKNIQWSQSNTSRYKVNHYDI